MNMIPSTGLWAKLKDETGSVRFFPIVAIVGEYENGEATFHGVMAIDKDMYLADTDEQFAGYVTDEEKAGFRRATMGR